MRDVVVATSLSPVAIVVSQCQVGHPERDSSRNRRINITTKAAVMLMCLTRTLPATRSLAARNHFLISSVTLKCLPRSTLTRSRHVVHLVPGESLGSNPPQNSRRSGVNRNANRYTCRPGPSTPKNPPQPKTRSQHYFHCKQRHLQNHSNIAMLLSNRS